MVNRRLLILCLALGIPGAAVLGHVFSTRFAAERDFAREIALAVEQAAEMRRHILAFTDYAVPRGGVFHDLLLGWGVDRATAAGIAFSAHAVYDLRQVRAGNRLSLGRALDGTLREVRYQIDPERWLWILPSADSASGFRAEIKNTPATTAVAGITGEIRDSLFDAVADAGEKPELALQLADIFGWDLDFHTDPRRGDTFRVAVEKKTFPDGTARYVRILAAEYVNAGHPYRAVLFRDPAGRAAYYAPDGNSLQKAFLRSPLKFSAPVTSRFSRDRFHPVLKVHRSHLGVDYGAPYGAPVQAIGDARVLFAGTNGGAGRMVHLRHANGYETMYLHLSRILVRASQHVGQGERIGLVGSSGLATGPHLDFRITQYGNYRNFETLRLPPAQPVAKRDWSEFIAARDSSLALLPDPNAPQLARGAASSVSPAPRRSTPPAPSAP